MARTKTRPEVAPSSDEIDKKILRIVQRDASCSVERLAAMVGISRTAAWNRLQRLHRDQIIRAEVALVDPQRVGLAETFFIAIRTNQHNADWLRRFTEIVNTMPEILEAHRLTGETDYLLKVQVASTRDFDRFYKTLVSAIDLYNVTSSLSMEVLKQETALPV